MGDPASRRPGDKREWEADASGGPGCFIVLAVFLSAVAIRWGLVSPGIEGLMNAGLAILGIWFAVCAVDFVLREIRKERGGEMMAPFPWLNVWRVLRVIRWVWRAVAERKRKELQDAG